MSDYPSIRLEDVREGDVVRGTGYYSGNPATVQGAVWVDSDGDWIVGGHRLRYLTDWRLISRPGPLRVGDWVRTQHNWQITSDGQLGYAEEVFAVRIEPPVGWPIGVPSDGGPRWYVKRSEGAAYYDAITAQGTVSVNWLGLLALGGVPALVVPR